MTNLTQLPIPKKASELTPEEWTHEVARLDELWGTGCGEVLLKGEILFDKVNDKFDKHTK